jgi:dihydrofolate reductase
MRRIVMFNRVTADGYFAAPDDSLEWVVPDPEFDRSAVKAIDRGAVDTVLFGRRTYQLFEQFWPYALDESSTSLDPHQPGRRSPEMRAMAKMLNEATKLVFSTTLTTVTWKNSDVVPTLDPREIEAMKRRSGGDIMIFGSGAIVSQLTAHGLIDEYQFMVTPVLLGSGRTLMDGVTNVSRLDLLNVTAFESGNVMLRYAR